MNIFRFSRGDFYGTIIPGSFLLWDISFITAIGCFCRNDNYCERVFY